LGLEAPVAAAPKQAITVAETGQSLSDQVAATTLYLRLNALDLWLKPAV